MSVFRKTIGCFMLLLLLTLSIFAATPWKDQVIYFVMIDRFWNGDTQNDVLTPEGIESGKVNSKYNGGDIAGLIQKLDYIKNLGATAIWITPPVANQWWDESVSYGGYHGYWARNYKMIDEHFGDVALYEEFIRLAHEKGLNVIQDIVTNHVGNFFLYDPKTKTTSINALSVPTLKPTLYPFDQNDFNDPAQRKMQIYHWPSEVTQPDQFNTALSDLDDLNTENPVVIEALKDAYGFWIDRGVDGFRIDTAIYIADPFWPKFLLDENGMYARAKANGKADFLVYGEAWVTPQPYEDNGEKLVQNYFNLGYNSMLDFTLMTELRRVFREGKPTQMLQYRLEKREEYFAGKNLITFVDNHDMERFLKSVSFRDLKQALVVIYTIPGIPTIYYGTEQGFVETRATMFKDGFESGGIDHFNPEHELYLFIQKLIQLRKETPTFRNGRIEVLHSDPTGPGAFVYAVTEDKNRYIIFLNTSSQSKYASQMLMGVPEGTVLEPVFMEGMVSKNIVVGNDGILNILLGGKVLAIYRVTDQVQEVKQPDLDVKILSLAGEDTFSADFVVRGTSRNAARVRLYIDGNEKEYATAIPDAAGNWEIAVRLSEFVAGKHRLFVRAFGKRATDSLYTPTLTIFLDIPTVLLADVADPDGDDYGPTGNYKYPKDITFERQQDILNVKLSQVGRTLRMDITMKNLTNPWSPTNGFDHVTFQIFFDRPDRKGAKELPYQNAFMPSGLDWDYEIYATGWSMAMFESNDTTGKVSYGKPITPTPTVQIDKQFKTLTLLVPMDVMQTDQFKDWKIYITTYDYDGIEAVLRPIQPAGGPWAFTGPSTQSPKIMDDLLIVIPK